MRVANRRVVTSLAESTGLNELHSPSLSELFPAAAGSVRPARDALVAFAMDCGAGEDELEAVRLASSEAITNAVVHAYDEEPGTIGVTAWLAGEELWVLIADDGSGLHVASNRPGLGLGLSLIAQLTDGFSVVNRSGGGTEVRMRFNLNAGEEPDGDQSLGSVASATAPASPAFSTTA
jgi:anti-sigma regulatory factor (Ser/Thr protein kinase)